MLKFKKKKKSQRLKNTSNLSFQSDHNPGSLKEELTAIILQLEEMQKRKCDRRNQVIEVLEQIQQISSEMQCLSRYTLASTVVDKTDLSLRKLEELQRELQALQKEKVIIVYSVVVISYAVQMYYQF